MTREILDIRHLETDQFTPLLEAESRAWRENLHWDYGASARLISNCLEEKRLSGYALVVENRIRGYCFFFYDGEKGLIGNLYAESDATDFSEVERLLGSALEKLAETPGVQRIEAQLPHYTFEQVEPCFRERCFASFRRRFMAASLCDWRTRAPCAAASHQASDFLIETWERKHDREAAELLCSTYRSHVDTAINDQYGSVAGTRRLIENIVHYAGCGEFLPGVSRVAIHRSTQRLAGVLALTAVGLRNAHIPQVGIAGEFQGVGLGSALLKTSFLELERQGYKEVSLTVTDLNAGAVRLYERLGFETYRPFGAFSWNRPL